MVRRPKKISLFLPDLNIGGAEKVFVNLANFLVSKGVEVDFLVMNDGGVLRENLDERVVFIRLLTRVSVNPIILFIKSVLGLRNYLKASSSDVLISTVFGANLVAVIASRWSRASTPVVIREASSLENYGLVKRCLIQCLFPYAERIVAVSHAGAEEMKQFFPKAASKITVISNGIDIDKLVQMAGSPLEGDYGSYIVAMGRLVDAKGFDVLISAFETIARTIDSINLVILGEGPLRPDLEKLVVDKGLVGRVFLPGFRENPYPTIKNAELFVLSSRWEGFPNALVEAINLGVKTVSTNCNYGPSEIFPAHQREKLVPVGDASALSEAMERALSDDTHIVVKKTFDNNDIFEDYLSLIG